jgi:hypothetical protein
MSFETWKEALRKRSPIFFDPIFYGFLAVGAVIFYFAFLR